MYGGTGRGRLSAVALTVSLLVAMTACRTQESASEVRVDPAPSTTDSSTRASDYETWEPSYGDVRPATADDVESLSQRVRDLNATSYTVEAPLMGLEIASTPDHLRVRFGGGGAGGFDLHLDPTDTTGTLLGSFVICSAVDDSCVEVGEELPEGGGPHLFNNGIDSIVFLASSIVGAQLALPDDLDKATYELGSSATVDSPSGVLDCLVTGGTAEQRGQLEGQPIELMADPVYREGDSEPLSTVCVDGHGLVVVTLPSLVAGVVPYGSFEPGVPADLSDHPDPVPYGESAPATPTADPTATPTPSHDPGTIQTVLVAADTIAAGESLADAQMTGKLELASVPGEEVVAGAVSSTEGIDGVAIEELTTGEQITEDSFR